MTNQPLRNMRRVRRDMYRGARVMGDVNAVASGNPKIMARRVRNRVLLRTLFALLRPLLRG